MPSLPETDASTTVRCSVSPDRSDPSSSSVAVPDSPATPCEAAPSRDAMITIEPDSVPGLVATTSVSLRVPLTVRAVNRSRATEKPYCDDPSVAATLWPSRSSADEPGGRDGYAVYRVRIDV